MDRDGRLFSAHLETVDVTPTGARLRGATPPIDRGAVIGLECGSRKARFVVTWIGQPGSRRSGQLGIRSLEKGKYVWGIPLPRTMGDDFGTEATIDSAEDAESAPMAEPGSEPCDNAGFEDRAIAICQRPNRYCPEAEAHYHAGLDLLKKGAVEGAIAEYRQALQLEPDYVEAHNNLASALVRKGDLAAATAEYREAIRLRPDYVMSHNNLAWLYATTPRIEYRNPWAALKHATIAVELTNWRNANFIDTLAEALYINGKMAAAAETEKRALALEPANHRWKQNLSRFENTNGKSTLQDTGSDSVSHPEPDR